MATTAAARDSTTAVAHRQEAPEMASLICYWLAEYLHRLRAEYMKLFTVSMDQKSITESLHGVLTMSTVLLVALKFIFDVTPESRTAQSDDDPGDGIFGLLCLLLPLVRNYLWVLLSDMGRFKGLDIYYMDNGVIVVMAYAFLLKINLQYCIIAPFPISLVIFIIHLCHKIRVKDKDVNKSEELVGASSDDSSRSKDGLEQDSSIKIGDVERTVAIPFFTLLIIAIYGDSSPVLSHFLLFSCCALGTMALLYSRLADEVTGASAFKPALECIQMSYMVMLFITAHTVVAEWFGDVTALICMPELIAGLRWFSALLHSDTSNRAVDKVTADEDSVSADDPDATEIPSVQAEQVSAGIFKGFILLGSKVIPLGAVLASLIIFTSAYDGEELLASWTNTKATIACGIAGCMPYLSVWMISRWPGSIPASDKATQQLKFLANVCLTGACLMLPALLAEKALAYGLFALDGLIDPSVHKYVLFIFFNTAVALLLGALFVMKGVFGTRASAPRRATQSLLQVLRLNRPPHLKRVVAATTLHQTGLK